MNPIVNKDYQTITHALENNNLVAITKEGHFKEVGTLGRIWRVLTGKGFKDCDAAQIGKEIVEFVKVNQEQINKEQAIALIKDLNILYKKDVGGGKQMRNFMNIRYNMSDIANLYNLDLSEIIKPIK